jgi:general secretion pathway protein J
MKKRRYPAATAEAGFTLVEALVAMALMAMVLGALASISSAWIPNWNHGIARLQRNESVALGIQRLTSDVAAAEFVSVENDARKPFFDGTTNSVTFVRTSLGPNARAGLEITRIAEVSTAHGPTVVRTRGPFKLQDGRGATRITEVSGDPVVLLRAPYSLSLAYSGADRVWLPTWQQRIRLPKAIKLTIRDIVTKEALSISTTVLLHSEFPVECIEAKSFAECLSILRPAATNEKPISEKQDG